MSQDLFEPGGAGAELAAGTLVLLLEAPPVPDVIEQAPVLEVYVEGTQHTLAYKAGAQFGFDQRVARASVTVATEIDNAAGQPQPTVWNLVEIRVGPSEAEKYTRFYGYFVKARASYLPNQRTWELRGRLHRAAVYKNPEPNGTDMSDGGAGTTDEEMVMRVLDAAGVPYTAANIGGTGALWGTLAYNADPKLNPFTWRKDETGIAFIERIDAVSTQVVDGRRGAFRTYEGIDGQIYRTHQSAVPDASTEFATFSQVQHILDGAESDLNDLDSVANRVTVTGWHSGEEQLTYTATGAARWLLAPGIDYVGAAFDSDMLERALSSDPGGGRSCQEQAEYLLSMRHSAITTATLPTYRGDRLEPGHTIRADAPLTLTLDSFFWLEGLAWEYDGGRWTQTPALARRDSVS